MLMMINRAVDFSKSSSGLTLTPSLETINIYESIVSGPFKIFGDIHGQYNDLMRLFFYWGKPCEKNKNQDINQFTYLFLGDYVDRGKNSVDVMMLIMCLKLRYPK